MPRRNEVESVKRKPQQTQPSNNQISHAPVLANHDSSNKRRLHAYPNPDGKLCDVNGDGSVTKFELKEALWTLGQHPSEEEMDLIFREHDTDQTGTLDFNEFKQLMTTRLTYKVSLLIFGIYAHVLDGGPYCFRGVVFLSRQ